MYLKPSQEKIILNLAKYKFLTNSHLLELGVMKYKTHISNEVRNLRKVKGLVDSIDFGLLSGEENGVQKHYGRLEMFHFLTPKGKKLLLEDFDMEEQDIKMPTKKFRVKDYFHRKDTLDWQIQFDKWIEGKGGKMLFFNRYFDMKGNNRVSKNLRSITNIPLEKELNRKTSLSPDAMFQLKTELGNEAFYILEVNRGSGTLKELERLEIYLEILSSGAVKKSHGIQGKYRILSVFEKEGIKEATIKRFLKNYSYENINDIFYFKTLKNIADNDIMSGWQKLDGTQGAIISEEDRNHIAIQ